MEVSQVGDELKEERLVQRHTESVRLMRVETFLRYYVVFFPIFLRLFCLFLALAFSLLFSSRLLLFSIFSLYSDHVSP